MQKKTPQFYLAIVLSGLAIAFGICLFTLEKNYIWYWGFGLAFGAVLQHFRICFVSAISEPFITKSTEIFRAILIGILVSSFGITCIKYLSNGALDMLGVSGINLALLIGAFLFGMGMVVAGCCSSGVFVRLAEGYAIHAITFLCILGGYFIAGTHYEQVWEPLSTQNLFVFLPEKLGWIGGISLHLALMISFYLIAWKHEKGTSPSNSSKYLIGGILIGILNILHHIVLNSGLSVIGAFSWVRGKSYIALGLNLRNFGLFVGALIAVLMVSNFKWKKIRSWKQVGFSVFGGLLMGYGARIAGGCNINAFFNAIASLSLSGWAFMVCLFAGTYVGMKILYKLM